MFFRDAERIEMMQKHGHLRLVARMQSNGGQMQQWGKVVQRELDARGMHKSELAQRIGRSPSTITRLLSDEEVPTLDVLIKIAEVFGLSLADLFLSDEQARILREYSPAAMARRDALIEQARHLLEASQTPHAPSHVDVARHSKAR
jgi:transcriptional regulator with XRE-family HTH domain